MEMKKHFPGFAVLGAGSVGCYFGGMLARAGAPVTLIGRPSHVEAIRRDGLLIESIRFTERVRVEAATDASAARSADVVLLTVKTTDTEAAARSLVPVLRHGAMILSLQNGVDNAARIRAASGLPAVPAVVYIACQMSGPGHVTHTGRGDLVLGVQTAPDKTAVTLEQVAACFEQAGVPCKIAADIRPELWRKLILNCAYNAISALTRARYGAIAKNPLTRDLLIRVVEEVVSVAHTDGIQWIENMVEAALGLAEMMPKAFSSTAQDVERGKLTEIDSLNGFVVARGKALGVPTPINQALHALVKLLEQDEKSRGW